MAKNTQESCPMEITPVHGAKQSVFNITLAYLWQLCVIAKVLNSTPP